MSAFSLYRRRAAAGLLLLLLAAPFGAPGRAAAAGSETIVIDHHAFSPATLTVAPGTRVTWVNRDNDAHTVTSAATPKLFGSAALDRGDSFSFAFEEPGTYKYFCLVHPDMQGTIVVR